MKEWLYIHIASSRPRRISSRLKAFMTHLVLKLVDERETMPGGSTERRSLTTSAILNNIFLFSSLGRGVCLCAKSDVSVEWYCLAGASIQDFSCRVGEEASEFSWSTLTCSWHIWAHGPSMCSLTCESLESSSSNLGSYQFMLVTCI